MFIVHSLISWYINGIATTSKEKKTSCGASSTLLYGANETMIYRRPSSRYQLMNSSIIILVGHAFIAF